MMTQYQKIQQRADEFQDFVSVWSRLSAEYMCFKPKPLERFGNIVATHQLVQLFMPFQTNQIRMYGTAEEFDRNLRIYWDFPLFYKHFSMNMLRVVRTIPRKYYSSKDELFYSKQELLFHLQSSVLLYYDAERRRLSIKNRENMKLDNRSPGLMEFMKNHEGRLNGCYEFVKYDKEVFDEVKKLFIHSQSLEDFRVPPGTEVTLSYGKATLVQYHEPLPSFKQIIKNYPHIFLPNKGQKNEKIVTVIRVFEDDGKEFMMEAEVFNAVNLKNPDGKKLKSKDRNGIFNAMELKEFNEKYSDIGRDIEYLPIPILRAAHAATPIVSPTAEFCILAADALVEILRRAISGLRIFQKVKKESWIMVTRWVETLMKSFRTDTKIRYFMKMEMVKTLKSETDEYWKSFERTGAREVREVEPAGFVEEELKKELKYLGVTDIFPEITQDLLPICSIVMENRETGVLRTCDMFYALELCQLRMLFKKFPMLITFLHHQKACGKYPYVECEECKNPKKVEVIASLDSVEPKEEEVKEVAEEIAVETETIEEAKDEKLNTEEMEQLKMRNSELEEEIKKKNERNTQLEKQIEQLKMRNVENKKKYEEEIKQLKLTASKSADDIVKLETRIKRKEAMEIQVKKSNDGRLRKLNEEIAQIKEKSDSEQMKLVMRQSEMEEEIKRFQNSKESEDLEIQEKISAIHNMLDSISTAKKLKNAEKSIKREASLKLAKEMVKRLSSTSPEFQQIADYEYQQFEAKFQNSESIPSFSEKFLDLYWENVIRNRLSDSECLICLENIISTQKTLKCECCKKVFHFECARKWLLLKRSCAHCREKQLNPEEFPNLS